MHFFTVILACTAASLVLASPASKSVCTKKSKTTTAVYPTQTATSCAAGIFNIQFTTKSGEVSYFVDYGNNPSFVNSNAVEYAGKYTLTGTTLGSVAVPNAVIYAVATPTPGPNPPPNGRTLFEAVPGTLNSTANGEFTVLKVTVTDQKTCSLAFTDGVRTAIGVSGFRGGPEMFIAPPGTTSNFDEAVSVRAIPVGK